MRARRAAGSSCASRTQTSSARPTSPRAPSSKGWSGSASATTTRRSSSSRATPTSTARPRCASSHEGKAYRDFTPKGERTDANVKQEIAERARAQAEGSGTDHRANPYSELSLEESERRAEAGEPFAVRLKVSAEGQTRFVDAVYGEQARAHSEIEDLVLLRSGDLSPLYNLSVVVDDIEMGITHVIRGQDHLTNTHKQVLIYEALGAQVPDVRAPASDPRAEQGQALEAQARRGRQL